MKKITWKYAENNKMVHNYDETSPLDKLPSKVKLEASKVCQKEVLISW